MTKTFIQTVRIRSKSWAAYRKDEWAEITGMDIVRPASTAYSPRLCYVVTFSDGVTDSWVVYDDDAQYEFQTDLHTVEQPR